MLMYGLYICILVKPDAYLNSVVSSKSERLETLPTPIQAEVMNERNFFLWILIEQLCECRIVSVFN